MTPAGIFRRIRWFIFSALILVVHLAAGLLAASESLPAKVAGFTPWGWQIFDRVKQYTPQNLYEQINGRASLFLAYDVIQLTFVSFVNQDEAENFINLSIYDMDTPTDYVDAYYLMAVDNPALVRSEEVYNAFLKGRAAGKVGYFGLGTHKNAAKVLEAAIQTGWYDLAMIGITPAGWYDWGTKSLALDSPPLTELQPLLKQAGIAGIGLIGMKAGRYLAPYLSLGKGDPTAFDHLYGQKLQSSFIIA